MSTLCPRFDSVDFLMRFVFSRMIEGAEKIFAIKPFDRAAAAVSNLVVTIEILLAVAQNGGERKNRLLVPIFCASCHPA